MWPGLMGIFSTHVVMQAKTYVKDQKLGIQTFVVEIRDPKTYKTREGVEVGDQGPKLGKFLNFFIFNRIYFKLI